MKSKTSFFNITALKKDITRYAPIWAFYTVFLLLMLFNFGISAYASTADMILDFIPGMAWVNLFYAGICAAFLLMDLFNGRLCNALHAFPMRRESWLSTHILAGLLFSFVPNLFVCLLACLMTGEFAYVPFIWLAAATMQFLFFFGTAILSAMCAGNLLGMMAVYAITHLITLFVTAVATVLYQPLLYGVYFDAEAIYHWFPLSQMSEFRYTEFELSYEETGVIGKFMGFIPTDWRYLGICAGFGVIALILAFLVYRCRHLESAGDLISFGPLSPLFVIICTVGAGLFLYLFSEVFGRRSYFLMIAGAVIGYFTARMLLNRTLKVFTKKAFLGLAVMIAVILGTLGLTALDPFGITRYVPELDKIANVRVIGADKGNHFYSYDGFSYNYRGDLTAGFPMTDKQEIAGVQDFHKKLISYRPADNAGTQCDVTVVYTLQNGRTVVRFYDVERESDLGKQAGEYFSDIRYVFEVSDPEFLYWVFESVTMDAYFEDKGYSVKVTDAEEITGLINAIQADCDAGLMAQNWAYHDKLEENYYLDFSAKADVFDYTNWNTSRLYLRIWPDCINWLKNIPKNNIKHREQMFPVLFKIYRSLRTSAHTGVTISGKFVFVNLNYSPHGGSRDYLHPEPERCSRCTDPRR